MKSIDRFDTKKRKERFLDFYKRPESAGNISIVCSAVPISRETYYLWLEKDEKFRKAMYDLKMEKCDEAEQELYRRGLEKDTTALIFWLKNNHEGYKEEKQPINLQVNVVPILGKDTQAQ